MIGIFKTYARVIFVKGGEENQLGKRENWDRSRFQDLCCLKFATTAYLHDVCIIENKS